LGHITFVHGIANKTDPDALLETWRAGLIDNDGIDLDDLGVTVSMVYWADMLYAAPLPAGRAQESSELELAEAVAADAGDLGWLSDLPPDERAFVTSFAKEVGLTAEALEQRTTDAEAIADESVLESIPLPDWLKVRLMRALLRDVHHYLYDVEFSPRPGESFRIRRDLRTRALTVLQKGAERPRPHVLVGHSLGSVIAYDMLAAVDETPAIDAFVTCGSPLGIDEVQQRLMPPWTRSDGWPSQRLLDGPWTNVYDTFDPVCGGWRAALAGHYQRGSVEKVADLKVHNEGSWRHSIGKYLGQDGLRNALRDVLT